MRWRQRQIRPARPAERAGTRAGITARHERQGDTERTVSPFFAETGNCPGITAPPTAAKGQTRFSRYRSAVSDKPPENRSETRQERGLGKAGRKTTGRIVRTIRPAIPWNTAVTGTPARPAGTAPCPKARSASGRYMPRRFWPPQVCSKSVPSGHIRPPRRLAGPTGRG